MNIEEKKTKFTRKFQNLEEKYNIDIIINAFGVFSKVEDQKIPENASLFTIYIKEDELSKNNTLKKLHISATYGKVAETGGVYIRDNQKISSPIDLISEDYLYDFNQNKIIYRNKELSANELIDNIYNLHVLPTKKFKGICIRFRLYIWRILFVQFFHYFSKIFHYLLYIITGDKYSYDTVFDRTIVNGMTIASSIDSMIDKTSPQVKDGKKINFLGYDVDLWPIVFYSIFTLAAYLIFELKDARPVLLVKILNNNFLLALYVVVSLWLIDVIVPIILKWLIKFNSKKAFSIKYKRLKI